MQTVLSSVVSWQLDSPSRYPPLHRLFPGTTGSGAERQLPDLGTKYTQKQKNTVINIEHFQCDLVPTIDLTFCH